MMNTRLLASGAFSAIALMLAAASAPASAAAQVGPDIMIAPDSGPVAISASVSAPAPSSAVPTAAMQDRGRGERSGGGRRGGGGGWNGGQGGAGGGGWQRGVTGGGVERSGGGWQRGGMPARSVDGGGVRAPRNPGSYGGGYNGERGAGRSEGGWRGNRGSYAGNPAAINRGDIQAPPNYNSGNRAGAASPWVRNDNLRAQGVPVGGADAAAAAAAGVNAGRANFSDRRGGGRGDWNGNRGGGNRGNWNDGRRGNNWNDGRRDGWRGNDNWRGNRDGWRGNRNDWRGGRQFGYNQGFRDGLRWDRGWRDNRRFDWIGHRRANRFLFTPGPYFSPFAGHFYRPVGIGFVLDPLFFQPRFFLDDPWAFRLPPAGDRFRWVRYYNDVLLVDVFSGEVVDVIENFFW